MSNNHAFEDNAARYDRWFDRNTHIFQSELAALKDFIPENTRGLEVGAGTGRFGPALGILEGVEPSKKMGEMAMQRGMMIVEGVGEELPYDDEYFGVVLMVTTVCFLDDIEKAFSEAYRVLRKGGYLVLGFIDKDSWLGCRYMKGREEPFYSSATFFSPREIIALLEEAGFRGFAVKQTLFKDLDGMEETQPVKEGYGEGAFVALKCSK